MEALICMEPRCTIPGLISLRVFRQKSIALVRYSIALPAAVDLVVAEVDSVAVVVAVAAAVAGNVALHGSYFV